MFTKHMFYLISNYLSFNWQFLYLFKINFI